MNIEELYEQYHKKGGEYIIPVEVFNNLLDEIENLERIINNTKQTYYDALEKANKNGTYVDKVAVEMFNILEGNGK